MSRTLPEYTGLGVIEPPPSAAAPMTPSAPYLWSCAPPLRFGARSCDVLQRVEDRGGARQGPSQVEGSVEVFLGERQLRVALEHLAEWTPLVPRLAGARLHEPVGVVARRPRGDQREEHRLAEDETERFIEVGE